MGDPAGEEDAGGWTACRLTGVDADMVDGHDDHDGAPQQVDGWEAGAYRAEFGCCWHGCFFVGNCRAGVAVVKVQISGLLVAGRIPYFWLGCSLFYEMFIIIVKFPNLVEIEKTCCHNTRGDTPFQLGRLPVVE